MLEMDATDYMSSAAVRALIVKEHNLEILIGRIVQEMGSRR